MSRKALTKETVNIRFRDRGITVTGDYLGALTKTEFQCQNGHKWTAVPNSVLQGTGCPHCVDTSLTKEIVNERLHARGITVTGDYLGALTKTEFQCQNGHKWTTTPNSVLRGKGCPHCSGKVPLTKEIVNERLHARGITMTGEYTGVKFRTEFQCQYGHKWTARIASILDGSGCPDCAKYGFNPNKPAVVYAFTRDNYLKIGITNDLPRRLKEHRKHGEINMVYEEHYAVGKHAQIQERTFKQKHGGSYVTKEECPDGYTETFPLNLLEQLSEYRISGVCYQRPAL